MTINHIEEGRRQIGLDPIEEKVDHEFLPSEILYGFAGWLTCREERTILSSYDNASPAAEAVAAFIDVNNLTQPRPGKIEQVQHPMVNTASAYKQPKLDPSASLQNMMDNCQGEIIQHIEKMAAAYILETKIRPEEAVLVVQTFPDRLEYHIERKEPEAPF